MSNEVVILSGCRTPIGSFGGSLKDTPAPELGALVVREAVGDRAQAAHDQSLFDLHAKYADVVTVAETLEYLSGIKARR